MAAFNLTAEIQLQAPNTKRVASQIQRDLSGINLNLNVGKSAKNLAAVQQNLGGVAKQGDRASKSFNLLSRNVAEAARRFSVITVATGSFIALTRGIKSSIGSAIEFQRELVKISQVTGKNLDQLKGLQNEVTRLSTSLGVANADLLQTSRVLAQAGLSALKTRQALEVLAQTTLAPTFDTIIDTTEGAIAILNQFGREAAKTGNDIKFLENSLDAINAVSKNFAVESSDLIATVRRTGGVFEAAGGNLKELIALFTSVRQTTREGAETIATGFRTIFTRLQRKDTIEALNELGISLQDAEGKFIGPLKAIEKLSIGLAGLDPKDVRFNEIVEQLGGFRQIGKVIPLIKQFQVTQQALAVANNSVGSTSKDAQEAQKSLAVQLGKTRESFDALIRKFTDSSTFQDSAKFVLKLANTFLKFAESLETVLPLLTQFAAIKLGRSLAPGLSQLFGRGSQRRNAGGKILGFNRGGLVPGQGNGDTVPAMLEPGEFVIRKSSVKELGSGQLHQMNNNRYNKAGVVKAGSKTALENAHLSTSRPVKITKSKTGQSFNAQTLDNLVIAIPREINQALKGKSEGNVSGHNLHQAIQAVPAQTLFRGQLASKRGGYGDLKKYPEAQQELRQNVETYKSVALNAINKEKVYHHDADLDPIGQAIRSEATPKLKAALDAVQEVVVKKAENEVLPAGMKGRSERRVRVAAKDTLTKRASGGLIQKLALGGIAQKNKIGAAILDPDMGKSPESVSVGVKDVSPYITKSTEAQAKGISKEYSSKKYSIVRQGLNQKTSDGFKNTLLNGAAKGVNDAVSGLGEDLGLGSVKPDPSDIGNLKEKIRSSGALGGPFENALNLLSNKGRFKPSPANAPFDFPDGLSGAVKDNYDNLPGSYIDAKSSYSAAETSGMKGKIAQEIAAEYKGSSTYKSLAADTGSGDKAGIQKALRSRFPKRSDRAGYSLSDFQTATGRKYKASELKELGFTKSGGTNYLNSGGSAKGPAPSDTVPALLTPGEFVFRKEAAQSIGYDKLGKMNKKGVKGFAKGGAVGVQKFKNGGTAETRGLDALGGGDGNLRAVAESLYIEAVSNGASVQEGLNITASQLNEYIISTSSTYEELSDANREATAATGAATPAQSKLNAQVKARSEAEGQVRAIAAKALKLQRSGIGIQESFHQATREVTEQQGKSLKPLKELQKSAIELVAARKAAKAALKRGYSNIGGGEDPQAGTRNSGPDGSDGSDVSDGSSFSADELNTKADTVADSLGSTSDKLNQVSTAAIGLTLVGGTLIESWTGLDDVTKKQYQAVLNSISASVALYAQFGSLGLEFASTIIVSRLRKQADTQVAAAATKAAAALNGIQPDGGGGGGGGGKGGKIAAGVGGVLAGVAVLRIGIDAFAAAFVAGQKAVQEAANKAADKELERVSAGTGGSEEKFVAQRRKAAEADLRIQTRNKDDSGRKTAASVTGVVAGLAAVAVAVNVIPVAGQAASIALIGLAATVLAGAAAVGVYNAIFATSSARLEENLSLAGNAAEGYARTQFRATKSAQALSVALKEAADAGVSTSQQIQVLAAATDSSASEYADGTQRLEKARAEEAKLRKNLIEDGVLTAGGNVSADAAGNDDAQDQIKSLDELTKGREAAEKSQIDLIRKVTAESATFRTLAQKAVSEGLKDISKLGPAALANVSSFDDLAAKTPGLADAFNKAKEKIQLLNKLKLNEELKGEKDPAVRQALIAKAAAQTKQSLVQLDTESKQLILSEKKLAKSALLADQAQRQQALTLSRVNKNLSAFNLLLLQSSKLKEVFGAIDDAGATEFGAVEFDTSIFDVTFKQLNDKAIERINQLGSGTIGKDADGFAKNIRDVKSITKSLPSVFLDFKRDTDGKIIDLPTLKKQLTEQIASSVPGGLDGLGGDIRAIIEKNADEAISSDGGLTGGLSFEDQKKLQDELEASIEAQIAVFKRAVELQNQFLGKLSQINTKIVAAQEGIINAQAKFSEVFERNADRLANANEKPRSRQEREEGRTRTANLNLGATARNAGARAGDVNSTAKAFKDLNKEAARLRREQRELAQSTKGNIDINSQTSIEVGKLQKGANDAAKGAARARAELERLADQSARAADVEKDLTKLREKRSEAESLQESIAFGSDDQRQEIFKGFRLLQQAFNQGGIQGATGDQRAAIGGALDSIGSQLINFEGQQVTGKELKQIFAARETGRLGLGGLNNFIDNLRKAENPLLGELKDIAQTELVASAALAGIAGQELQTLKSIDSTLKTTFQEELDNAKADAQQEFGGSEDPQQQTIDSNAETLLELTKGIAEQTIAVAKQTELMTRLSENTLTAIKNLDTAQSKKRERQESSTTATTRSRGGPAYFNDGGVVPGSAPTPKGMEEVFKPKGTDTVPAYLSKGEFVVKKSSVDKIGTDALEQMNNGGTVYAAKGGYTGRPPKDLKDATGQIFGEYVSPMGDLAKDAVKQTAEFGAGAAKDFRETTGLGGGISGNPVGSIGFLLGAENATGEQLLRDQFSRKSQIEQMDNPLGADKKIKELRDQGYTPESISGVIGPTLTGSGSLGERGLFGNIAAAEGYITGNDREADFQEAMKADNEERARKNKLTPNQSFAEAYEGLFDASGVLGGSDRYNSGSSPLVGQSTFSGEGSYEGLGSIVDNISASNEISDRFERKQAKRDQLSTLVPVPSSTQSAIQETRNPLDLVGNLRRLNEETGILGSIGDQERTDFNEVQGIMSESRAQSIRNFNDIYKNEFSETNKLLGGPFVKSGTDTPNERNPNFPDDVNRDRLLAGLPAGSNVAAERIRYLRENGLTDSNAAYTNEEVIAYKDFKSQILTSRSKAESAKDKEEDRLYPGGPTAKERDEQSKKAKARNLQTDLDRKETEKIEARMAKKAKARNLQTDLDSKEKGMSSEEFNRRLDADKAQREKEEDRLGKEKQRSLAESVAREHFNSKINDLEQEMKNTISGSEAYNQLKIKKDQLEYAVAQGYTNTEYLTRLNEYKEGKKQAAVNKVTLGSKGRSTIQDRIAVLNEASIGENNIERKAKLDAQIAKLNAQQSDTARGVPPQVKKEAKKQKENLKSSGTAGEIDDIKTVDRTAELMEKNAASGDVPKELQSTLQNTNYLKLIQKWEEQERERAFKEGVRPSFGSSDESSFVLTTGYLGQFYNWLGTQPGYEEHPLLMPGPNGEKAQAELEQLVLFRGRHKPDNKLGRPGTFGFANSAGTQQDLAQFDQSLLVGSGMAITKEQELQIKKEEYQQRKKTGQKTTSRDRFRDRITPRSQRGTPSQAAPAGAVTKEEAEVRQEENKKDSRFSQTMYNRLLRTNGPAVANRYARANGKTPDKAKNKNQADKKAPQGNKQIIQFLLNLLKQGGVDTSQLIKGFNNGGGTVDNIPAMLTSGEFVMNAKASKQIGIPNLKDMNEKGVMPQKFAKGGVVGGMKTSYLKDGGSPSGGMGPLEINVGPFSEVLNKFSAAFGNKLDNVVGQFDYVAGAMDNLAQSISQGMKVTHSFNGDMKMTFSMSDEQTTNIVNAVGDAMTPKMEEIIKREVDQKFNKNSFKSGG